MTAPLCVGKWELFDSTDPGDHDQAAKICGSCEVRACDALRDLGPEFLWEGGKPALVGTWAGQLYGQPSHNQARIATEDAMFSDDDARLAHRAWNKGERDDRTRIGERVYQRRAQQRQRARRDAA